MHPYETVTVPHRAQGVIMEADLGPDEPRWRPKGEDEIRSAVELGLIAESHHIDGKRETGHSAGARKETARDLASFALDAGALLIGVEEDKDAGRFSLAPQPLNGVVEKIEQIAAMAIEPPLPVVPVAIPSDADPTVGYLLVHVPPSPAAPHMVDGRYYGRGERTRRVLSDAEVLRLHARRESLEAQGARLLDAEINRDPVQEDARALGHLYLVAQPIAGPPRLAHGFVRGEHQPIYEFVHHAPLTLHSEQIAQYAPTPDSASVRSHRSNGVALCSHKLSGRGRTLAVYNGAPATDDGRLLDIELRDDGGIRILAGRMTAMAPSNYGDAPTSVIMDGLAVAFTRRLINWAVSIGERTGWHGMWLLGLHGDGLRGLESYLVHESMRRGHGPTFDVDDYREVTKASHLEMAQRPGTVAYRLVGRMVETLGTINRFEKDLADAPPDTRTPS